MCVTAEIDLRRLAAYLQEWLDAHNMKAKNLADIAGISHVTIGAYLRGEGNPSPDTLQKIAVITGDPPEYLYRVAGLLPETEDEPDYVAREIRRIIQRLPDEKREEAIRILEAYARVVEDEARRAAFASKYRHIAKS